AVHRYGSGPDQELVGFVAAGLAFGRVASILQSIDKVLKVIEASGKAPAAYVRSFEPRRDGPLLEGLAHRWTRGPDLVALFWILRMMLEEAGSVEGFFRKGDDPSTPDVGPGLESFSSRALAFDLGPAYGEVPARPGVCYFFPRPSAGSARTRLNLYLRWMVRRDAVDLGIWTQPDASRLIVPLDVHLIRMGQSLGLTRYKGAGWRMAAEITASLRQVDAKDPVRFDFALCHLSMSGGTVGP
ncbi:MAG: TIGR02757 family protein, partial [Acidobacteria bacterium]